MPNTPLGIPYGRKKILVQISNDPPVIIENL